MISLKPEDAVVSSLGPREHPSPLGLSVTKDDGIADYVRDDARVVFNVEVFAGQSPPATVLFERAGPRTKIFFDPSRVRAGIVTCGGLCPGVNNVIRSLVLQLHHKYGVPEILGFRYGFSGLDPESGKPPVVLTPDVVRMIHRSGGSALGIARGDPGAARMVDALQAQKVDVLFTIGGEGTLQGAHQIAEEIARRKAKIAIVGIPKTIDNDVPFVDQTFGYDTAVQIATLAVDAAHTEAHSAPNGIAVVKLMGRDAGFIAAAATRASREVNFCLIPEVPFDLGGPRGLLAALEDRLKRRGHALIVVAEGCDWSKPTASVEKSSDVGRELRAAIRDHFEDREIPITLKYIDPSYMIRSVPANAHDAIYCDELARHAAHAAMAGKTDIVIGSIHGLFTHVPLVLVSRERKRLDPDGGQWLSVTEATGQPVLRNGG